MSRALFPRGLVLGLLAMAGCGSPPPAVNDVNPRVDERIRPGDLIRLEIWREEDASGEFPVDQSGHVALPRVGHWDVSQDTEATLRTRLVEELGRSLRHQSIEVAVLRRVQVLGAVGSPGLYNLDGTMRLGDALAKAGGVSLAGHQRRVDVVRDGERFMVTVEEDRRMADLPLRSGDVVIVPHRNWFLRNYGVLLTGFTTAAGVLAVVLTR